MYGFWRLGFKPAPSAGAACTANGVATTTSRNEKNSATAAHDGDDPGDEITRLPVEQNRGGAVAGQDQQPEEQRSLLSTPEGRDRVAGRQLTACVLRDVDEREVVTDERDQQDDRRNGARDEGADECVARGESQAAPALPGRDRPGDDGVEREPERGDECGAAQLRHGAASGGLALLGGVLRRALRHEGVLPRNEDAVPELALDGDLAVSAELIRHGPFVEHGDGLP